MPTDPLTEMIAVVEGTGTHATHERRQVGRCVSCSCGARVQGRMPVTPPTTWRVVLADGFVAWTGRDRTRADEVAARNSGAKVEAPRAD